jgi:hypothetical protein
MMQLDMESLTTVDSQAAASNFTLRVQWWAMFVEDFVTGRGATSGVLRHDELFDRQLA